MKLKTGLTFLFLILGQLALANMASPIRRGTMTSSAISSKDINIVSEKVFVKVDPGFKTAKFTVEYNIQSDISGMQIPLLFVARDFRDSFSVWIDDKEVRLQNVPVNHYEDSPFNGFANSLERDNYEDEITIYWERNSGNVYKLSDLKYFEADIEKGAHVVRVEYTANAWTNSSGWVKKYSFRYSLTPAKFWKSFGNLEIAVVQDGQIGHVETNLGLPDEKEIKSTNTWTFNKLPDEYFEISYTPEISGYARALIDIEPFGFAVITLVFLSIIHLFLTLAYRRKNINRKYSIVVILGSVLIPFLSMLSFVFSFDLIDNAIGENAGRHHGYAALSIIFHPVILVVYLFLFWLADKLYKKKLIKNNPALKGGSITLTK